MCLFANIFFYTFFSLYIVFIIANWLKIHDLLLNVNIIFAVKHIRIITGHVCEEERNHKSMININLIAYKIEHVFSHKGHK